MVPSFALWTQTFSGYSDSRHCAFRGVNYFKATKLFLVLASLAIVSPVSPRPFSKTNKPNLIPRPTVLPKTGCACPIMSDPGQPRRAGFSGWYKSCCAHIESEHFAEYQHAIFLVTKEVNCSCIRHYTPAERFGFDLAETFGDNYPIVSEEVNCSCHRSYSDPRPDHS